MKTKGRRILTTAAFVVLLVTPAIFFVSAATATTVEINNTGASPDATTTTAITAYEIENLGNFGITVTFNHTVVNVTDVTGGPDVGAFDWQRLTDDSVRLCTLNILSTPSLTGNVILATLTLHAVGTRKEDIPPTIDFISPTPENNSINTTGYVNVTVNVTDPAPGSDIDVVSVSVWNETGLYLDNITLAFDGHKYYYIDNVSSPGIPLPNGNYTYRVYATDTAGSGSSLDIEIGELLDNGGNSIPATPANGTFTIPGNVGMSETRVVVVNMTEGWPKIGDMTGDGSVTFDDVILLAKHIYFGEAIYP